MNTNINKETHKCKKTQKNLEEKRINPTTKNANPTTAEAEMGR